MDQSTVMGQASSQVRPPNSTSNLQDVQDGKKRPVVSTAALQLGKNSTAGDTEAKNNSSFHEHTPPSPGSTDKIAQNNSTGSKSLRTSATNGKNAISATALNSNSKHKKAGPFLLSEAWDLSSASSSAVPASLLNDTIYDGQPSKSTSEDFDSSSHFTSSKTDSNRPSINAQVAPVSLTSTRRATATQAATTECEQLFFPLNDPQSPFNTDSATSPHQTPHHKRNLSLSEVSSDGIVDVYQPPSKRIKRIPREQHRSLDDIEENGGKFTEEELTTFEAWKDEYRRTHRLTKEQLLGLFNEKSHKHSQQTATMYKDLYMQFPNRKEHAVRKFACRNAGWVRRGAAWTTEEDDLIKELKAQHPKLTYKEIGNEIGRFHEDVRNRYRDKLDPAIANAIPGRWTSTEEAEIYRAFATCEHKTQGQVPLWPAIVKEMGGTRTRSSCVSKWADMEKKADHKTKLRNARAAVEAAAANHAAA